MHLLIAITAAVPAIAISTGVASLPGMTAKPAPAPTAQSQPAPSAAAEAPSPGRAMLGRQAISFLASLANNPDPDVRAAVCAAWGQIGQPAPPVLKMLDKAGKDRDDFVRIEAGVSLLRLGDEHGRRILMDIVRSSAPLRGSPSPAHEMKFLAHTKARAQALLRLSDLANEDVVALMEKTLHDASGAVRDATAVSLCRLDLGEEPAVAPFLRQLLGAAKDPDDTVRAAAVKALGDTKLSSVLPALKEAAGDASAAVRAEAVTALIASGDESLAPLFIERLQDESLRVRYLAAGGLARLSQDPAALPVLRRLAADPKAPDLALRAMTGLAGRGEKVDLGLAQRQLQAKDVDGRMLALEGIAAVPGEPALQLLAGAMAEDGSVRVRVAAAQMLVKRLQEKRSP